MRMEDGGWRMAPVPGDRTRLACSFRRLAGKRPFQSPVSGFTNVMRMEDGGWRMAKPPCRAFREASWSAVAERSGDTAFAPPLPLRDVSPGIARVSRALFGVSPESSVPISGLTFQRFNASTLQRFNDSTIQRFNDSTIQRRRALFRSPFSGFRSYPFNDSTVQRFNASTVQHPHSSSGLLTPNPGLRITCV
jgi:hypothetical protein